MARASRSLGNREPNWKLAFGSVSFLLVWVLGLMAGVGLGMVLFRALTAAALGTALGAVVGMTLKGLKNLANEPPAPRGGKLDVLVADEPAEEPPPAEASKVVPQAEADPFQPIDFKAAAKHVQGLVKE
jgi:hypothetical protein